MTLLEFYWFFGGLFGLIGLLVSWWDVHTHPPKSTDTREALIKQIKDLEHKAKSHRADIRVMQAVAEVRNKQLTAMGWVWCSGTCGKPLVQETVDLAIRNTDRMIEKFNNQQGNRAWKRLQPYPEEQNALSSAWQHFRIERDEYLARLKHLEGVVQSYKDYYGN